MIDAGLSKYFDSIPHSKLLRALAQRIADAALLHPIRLWLKAPVVAEEGGNGAAYWRKSQVPRSMAVVTGLSGEQDGTTACYCQFGIAWRMLECEV